MIINLILDILAWVNWKWLRKLITGKSNALNRMDQLKVRNKLYDGYYIILTVDRNHLSSWSVRIANLFLTGKWSDYSHALVNVEPDDSREFRFVEAINKGVVVSDFDEVLACDAICILKPKYYTLEEFNEAVGSIYVEIGKKYDKRFKHNDPNERSCVEVARARLQALPEYETRMRVFEHMIKTEKTLTPQMIRDCPDFEVVLEIKR